MKSFLSLPNNGDFFNRYALLTPTLYKVGYLAQVISALTEFGILYSLIFDGLADFFPQYAPYGALFGAIVGTAILEIGLRQFAPYSVRAILHRRFAGLDLVMTVFILATTAGLLVSSGVLSFKGSREMVAAVAPEAEQQTTTAADSAYQAARMEASSAYQLDSAAIATRYAAQIAAKRQEYDSKADIQRSRISRYKARERAENQSYATAISHIETRIATLEAERDKAVADLEARRGDELAVILQRRQTAIDQARDEYATAKGEVKQFNRESIEETESKTNKYGYGLAWFTVVCIIVFLFSVILHEVHHKGSGIELTAQPSQYDFSGSWIAEALAAANSRWQYAVRSRIHSFDSATPDPPLPVIPGALYNLAGMDQRRYQIATGEDDDDNRVIHLQPRRSGFSSPTPLMELADKALQLVTAQVQAESQNLHAAAREIELKAVDVIRAYLGPKANDKAVGELYSALVAYVNGVGENPFKHLHSRRPIGFWKGEKHSAHDLGEDAPLTGAVSSSEDASLTGAVRELESDLLETCPNCGGKFQKKVGNQKYCSHECRLDFHARKHGGKRYDPNFKYKK